MVWWVVRASVACKGCPIVLEGVELGTEVLFSTLPWCSPCSSACSSLSVQ